MESDDVDTKADLPTNELRNARRRRKALLQVKGKPVSEPETKFNEMAAKQISPNTSTKLKGVIGNVNSENGVWPYPGSMAEGSLTTGKDKVVCEQENNSLSNLKCGSISLIGRRRAMEDTVTVEPEIIPGKFAFLGVYDGHGGASVANSCRDRLHKLLEEELVATTYNSGEGVDWTKVMMTCFSKMDNEVIEDKYGVVITSEKVTAGSTATVVIVGVEEIVVANCGDSRAVLSCGGVAVPLSTDHKKLGKISLACKNFRVGEAFGMDGALISLAETIQSIRGFFAEPKKKPNRVDEMKRVEAAGGHIIDWNGYRVQGVLAISRSIGDHYLRPYVISEPTVTVNKRSDSDEFLILATDGLWDVVSNETACDVVRKCFNGRTNKKSPVPDPPSPTDIAAFLAEMAIARGSGDNVSIIVVDLKMGTSNIY